RCAASYKVWVARAVASTRCHACCSSCERVSRNAGTPALRVVRRMRTTTTRTSRVARRVLVKMRRIADSPANDDSLIYHDGHVVGLARRGPDHCGADYHPPGSPGCAPSPILPIMLAVTIRPFRPDELEVVAR